MKNLVKIMIILLLASLIGSIAVYAVHKNDVVKVEQKYESEIIDLRKQLEVVKAERDQNYDIFKLTSDSLDDYKDSVALLNEKPLMTKKHFKDLFALRTIEERFRLCERRPSNRKFFYGWVRRALER